MAKDEEIEKLIQIALTGKVVEENKAASFLDDFIFVFEVEKSEVVKTPLWALYRSYRLWSEDPVTKGIFSREFSKHFKVVPGGFERALRSKSYFVISRVDTSDEAWWAEKRYEADKRAEKERKIKEKYKDKPYIKFRQSKAWAAYKAKKKSDS